MSTVLWQDNARQRVLDIKSVRGNVNINGKCMFLLVKCRTHMRTQKHRVAVTRITVGSARAVVLLLLCRYC